MPARRPLHKAVHAPCPNGATSWDACDKAAQEARGRCSALTKEAEECSNWSIDEHDGRGYCGQHYASAVQRELDRERKEVKRVELDDRITAYLAWRETHPGVWERMADGEGLEPSITRVTTEGPTTRRPVNGWRASGGLPFTRPSG